MQVRDHDTMVTSIYLSVRASRDTTRSLEVRRNARQHSRAELTDHDDPNLV